MSLLDKFKEEFVSQVIQLSQDEGMKDDEIAQILGCSRATVNRTRQAHEIPTANLDNRLDKECTCADCGKVYLIRRKERRKKRCMDCQELTEKK